MKFFSGFFSNKNNAAPQEAHADGSAGGDPGELEYSPAGGVEEARLPGPGHNSGDYDIPLQLDEGFDEVMAGYDASAAGTDAHQPEPAAEGATLRRTAIEIYPDFFSNSDIVAQNLEKLDMLVSQSRDGYALMLENFIQIQNSLVQASEIRDERDQLQKANTTLRLSTQETRDALTRKTDELESLNERNNVLKAQNDQRQKAIERLDAELENAVRRAAKLDAELAAQREESVRLRTERDGERTEKAGLEKANAELASKLAKVKEMLSDANARLVETEARNAKLAEAQRSMSGEQEKLRNELRASLKQSAEQTNRLLFQEDEIRQYQGEIENLKGRVAADDFAIGNELALRQSALRVAENNLGEAQLRKAELEKQLNAAIAAKNEAEKFAARLAEELKEEKRVASDASFRLSDVNMKYMTDLVSLDTQREANKVYQSNVEKLVAENRRLMKFESLYNEAESRIRDLKDKLKQFTGDIQSRPQAERLRAISTLNGADPAKRPGAKDSGPEPLPEAAS